MTSNPDPSSGTVEESPSPETGEEITFTEEKQ